MSTDDDEALSWAGDEPVATPPRRSPQVEPPQRVEPVETPTAEPPQRVEPVETPTADTPAGPDDSLDTEKHPLSPVLLVTYGILGGVYLICTIGWVVLVAGSGDVDLIRIDGIMFRVAQGLAVAAPSIWFGGTLLLSRGRRAVTAVGLLLLGLVVTLPWPILITGA